MTETRTIDDYGADFYKIQGVAFTSTSIPRAWGTDDIIFGEGSERSSLSGEEVVHDIRSGQEITYKVVTPGAEAPTEGEPEDSGIRFSDLADEVEVLVPYGYDKNASRSTKTTD